MGLFPTPEPGGKRTQQFSLSRGAPSQPELSLDCFSRIQETVLLSDPKKTWDARMRDRNQAPILNLGAQGLSQGPGLTSRKRNNEEKWEKAQSWAQDMDQNPGHGSESQISLHHPGSFPPRRLDPYPGTFSLWDKGQGWHSSVPELFPKFLALSSPHINLFPPGSAIPGQSKPLPTDLWKWSCLRDDSSWQHHFPLNSLQTLAGSSPIHLPSAEIWEQMGRTSCSGSVGRAHAEIHQHSRGFPN